MTEDSINNAYKALDWWRTSSPAEKEKVVKKWKAIKDSDYRKKWEVKRIGLSDGLVIELFNKFVKQ